MRCPRLAGRLEKLRRGGGFSSRGAICLALYLTHSLRKGGGRDETKFLCESRTQVRGLSRSAVNKILAGHGFSGAAVGEAGRTSPNSVPRMRDYLRWIEEHCTVDDLPEVERFWVRACREASMPAPLRLRLRNRWSYRKRLTDLFAQALARDRKRLSPRRTRAVLQHLVGAKLDLVLGLGIVSHHPVAEADQAEGRAGDFTPGDVAIHVTTHPSEALIARCVANLHAGLRPMIVTLPSRTTGADMLAETAGVANRVDVIDIEQFLAANLHERALFQKANHRPRVEQLIARYNELIDTHENDPSLRIEIAG
jgi:hypothetical protein